MEEIITKAGSGAGNPAGNVYYSFGQRGSNGTGGLMILHVSGNILIGESGSIQSNGCKGGYGNYTVAGVRPWGQGRRRFRWRRNSYLSLWRNNK